ncbi:putative cytochrome-like protein P450 [Massarina eburnea CBS 473.64]|uniref:Putative cytochrome-like protein P450 n=1 Tax=Massarina eburnea CBS 473.64 TaxID=1395130 RepID=A0A6A6S9T3_9PLEO|nr:putative cytochrome-like protein P450 [Massarina eburnea CBS 473.64]
MAWLLEFVQRQSVPLAFSLLVLIPFLTHYITTTLFYRAHSSKGSDKKPPTISYWLPVFCHGLGLLSRPSAYFGLLIKKYGDYAPFVVKVGRTSYLVIRDPKHVQKVFRESSGPATRSDLVEFYSKVLDAPKEAVDCYKSVGAGAEQNGKLHHARVAVPEKYFTGAALKSLTDTYISIFRRNMSNKMFQVDSWTQIEDFWSFFEIDITRATTETLFGSALLKQYPKLARDLWDFNSAIEEFLPGLPQFMVSSSVVPRDRLLNALKKWLQEKHGGTDFAKLDDQDPMWDEGKGSKFIQERDHVFANLPSFNYQARAVESLGVLQSSVSAIMPSTFWSIVETLRNPALAKFLAAEMDQYHDTKKDTYDIAAITELPNLQSLHTEIKRLRTATRLIHLNQDTCLQLDEIWTAPTGLSIINFSHDIGLNTALWTKASPRTVSRPLEEFWPDRFIIPDKSASTKRYRKGRDSVTTGAFSLDGVELLHDALGFANYSESERTFATAIQTATLAILLTEFEVELCDSEATEELLPPVREMAFGTVKPMDKIAIRIRKRVPGEKIR